MRVSIYLLAILIVSFMWCGCASVKERTKSAAKSTGEAAKKADVWIHDNMW